MIKLSKTGYYLIILVFFTLFISGCEISQVSSKLKWLDEKIGQKLNELPKDSDYKEDSEIPGSDQEKNKSAGDLTIEEKEKIDNWLEKNNLNRYGDSIDTMYAGGTPLFNEATGESIDRYDYILNNHLNLLNEIN